MFQNSGQSTNSNEKTFSIVLFNILEAIVGIKLAIIATFFHIINTLTLNCIVLKWFSEFVFDHLFHFLHDEHDHKYAENPIDKLRPIKSNFSSLSMLNNSFFKRFNLVTFDFTGSSINILEICMSSILFLTIFLIILLKRKPKSTTETQRYAIRHKIRIFFSLASLSVILTISFLSLSLGYFKFTIDCEHFFKGGIQNVSLF